MNPLSSSAKARGFSLVEIMVGMVIGLIGVIVMMQMFKVSEANKRISTGGSDAQNNGIMALYALQKEIKQSGYGSSHVNLIGCNVTLRAGIMIASMSPVTINYAGIPAGDANSDTLLIVYGNGNGSPEGDRVVSQPGSTTYAVTVPSSFRPGDWIIAEPSTIPSPCNLTMESVLTQSSSPPQITVATGVASMTNGALYNLGQAPQILAYAVRGGNLTVCDYMTRDCGNPAQVGDAAIWVPLVSGIISMRAQYGHDTTVPLKDGTVETYDQITPGSAGDTTTFSMNCRWVRVAAVRLALAARNGQYDKEDVTSVAPTWAGSTADSPPGSASAATPFDLSATPDWRHYRYRVFETTVPLRNIVSVGAAGSC